MKPLHTILGAGPLGRATALALAEPSDVQVRLAHRSGRLRMPSVEVRAADITDADQLHRAIAGSSVVYFCAQPPYHRWLAEFEPLLLRVIDACERSGAALVSASNLYMYGDAHGARGLSEDTPEDATSRKGRLRARMDARVLAAHTEGRIRAVVARASDFFGPGVEGSVLGRRVFDTLLTGGTARGVGDIDQPHSYAYVDDYGRALAELGGRLDTWGRVWHVPHAPALTTRELLTQAAAMAGVAPRLGSLGALALRAIGLVVPAVRETVELLPHFEAPYRVDDLRWRSRMRTRETPIALALAQTLDACRPGAAPVAAARA